MAIHGNINSKSDLEVGARSLELGIWGAYRNIVINMNDITDEAWKKQVLSAAEAMTERGKAESDRILATLEARHE